MAQPGLQPCLSPGSYTGSVKSWLGGTWTHVFPPRELLENSGERERQCRPQLYYLTPNIVKCSSRNCGKALGLLWDPADESTISRLLPPKGPPGAEQAPPLTPWVLEFGFVFSGTVHKSHWTRWDEKGTPKFLIKCCFPHAHIFSASRQGHSLSQSFFAFFSQY